MKHTLLLLIFTTLLSILPAIRSTPYVIQLQWDTYEGECNGILSGKIGDETGVVQGAGAGKALKGKIVSLGESAINNQGQTFRINSAEGFFSFWVRDKFADDDIAADPTLLGKAKPVIKLYRGNDL